MVLSRKIVKKSRRRKNDTKKGRKKTRRSYKKLARPRSVSIIRENPPTTYHPIRKGGFATVGIGPFDPHGDEKRGHPYIIRSTLHNPKNINEREKIHKLLADEDLAPKRVKAKSVRQLEGGTFEEYEHDPTFRKRNASRMEFKGKDLKQVLIEGENLSREQQIRLVEEIFGSLVKTIYKMGEVLAKNGFLCLDLKFENLLWDEKKIYAIDFDFDDRIQCKFTRELSQGKKERWSEETGGLFALLTFTLNERYLCKQLRARTCENFAPSKSDSARMFLLRLIKEKWQSVNKTQSVLRTSNKNCTMFLITNIPIVNKNFQLGTRNVTREAVEKLIMWFNDDETKKRTSS